MIYGLSLWVLVWCLDKFEDATLSFCEGHFSLFPESFIDKIINWVIEEIIYRLLDNDNSRYLQLELKLRIQMFTHQLIQNTELRNCF